MTEKIIVTGGAGFIGSHLVDRLLELGNVVTVIDDLSTGKLEFLKPHLNNRKFRFVHANLLNTKRLKSLFKGCDTVYHLAANPEVRIGNWRLHYEQNVCATAKILDAIRETKLARIVFTSTSTVYGEPSQIPTPETYGPLMPISVYGASKLAAEALISAYCHYVDFPFSAVIYRFANVVGPRGTHGVIVDFIRKLKKNPSELEILGDGTQTKSYCHVSDCIEAILLGAEKAKEKVGIFNIGTDETTNVKKVADIVVETMGLRNVRYTFTGGVDDGRGWKGDVKFMQLAIEKIKMLGWKPKYSSEEAVRAAARSMLCP